MQIRTRSSDLLGLRSHFFKIAFQVLVNFLTCPSNANNWFLFLWYQQHLMNSSLGDANAGILIPSFFIDYFYKDRLSLIFSSNILKQSLYEKGRLNSCFPYLSAILMGLFMFYIYSQADLESYNFLESGIFCLKFQNLLA